MGASAFTGATIGAASDLTVAVPLVFVSVLAVVSVVFAGLCFLVFTFFGVALAGSPEAVLAGIVALAAGAAGAAGAAAAGGVAGAGAAGAVVVVCATAVSEMARALALSAISSLFMFLSSVWIAGRHAHACRRH